MLTVLAASLGLALPATAAPDGGAYHLYRPNFRPPPETVTPNAATMLYYGGPVIASVKVVAVLWGTGVPKTTTSRLSPFFKAIVNSTYVDQLAQYSTVGIVGVNGRPGTNQTIGRGSYTGKFRITPTNTSTTLTDDDVQTELKAQIAAGKLPAADLNTLYMMYFPASITITLGGSRSCVSFGAYHEAVSAHVTAKNVFYGVMPDCGGGFASVTDVSSHEFAEAITDAIPTPGSHPAYPQAWNTSNGFEIGDLCQSFQTTLTAAGQTYVVQEVFTNSTNACAKGKFTSP
jgi:hypothetical protein